MPRLSLFALVLVLGIAAATAHAADAPPALLCDFEQPAEIAAFDNLVIPGAKTKEPPVKVEAASDHATSGKQCLKLTFAGGKWPAVSTDRVDQRWLDYQTFEADVFVSRPCLIGFTVIQEKSKRGDGWDEGISRWTKTALLQAGENHIAGTLPQPNDYSLHAKWGKVMSFEIFLYQPHAGEVVYLDNLRLTNDKVPPRAKTTFTVAGTDWSLTGATSADAVIELGKRLRDRWYKPATRTAAEIEEEFRAQYLTLKRQHPKAVLAILRDGEKGFDPQDPEQVYAGWRDVYFTSHGPDALYEPRAESKGASASQEVFMRHRSPLMRVDFSSIPAGSEILSARLMLVRTGEGLGEHNPEKNPTMWVVEPCTRPWVEQEANAFEFAKDKFWQQVGGMAWGTGSPRRGADRDFEPVFLAYGPSQLKTSCWDFATAVRYWTSGEHANHGFMFHGDSKDYLTAFTREAKEIADRPCVMVVYVPK